MGVTDRTRPTANNTEGVRSKGALTSESGRCQLDKTRLWAPKWVLDSEAREAVLAARARLEDMGKE